MTGSMTAPVAGRVRMSAGRLAELLGQPAPTREQAAVIESPLGPAVVIAGAGSGKTETMAARVVWLVANQLVAPSSVLGLTFTRKAAGELGGRIRRRLGQWRRVVERVSPDDPARLSELMAGEPTVSTYAAYAGRLVGEHAIRVGAEPSPRRLSEAVRWQLADSVARRYAGVLPPDIGALSSIPSYVLRLSDHLADHLVTAEDVDRFCERLLAQWEPLPLGPRISSPRPGETAKLIASTEHRRELMHLVRDFASAKRGAVDFADQMALAARVSQLADVARIERARFAAVLLDEYQDTGHAQTEMLVGLFGDGHPVTAVGDPFQSIYGWRGASAGTIDRFPARFPDAAGGSAPRFTLSTSWRNDVAVLDAANVVSAPLRACSIGTVVLASRRGAAPGALVVCRENSVDDEAQRVAIRMRQAWDERPAGERTAAVLVRRRAQIPVLAEALEQAGLPVEIVGLGGLLLTPEVVDVVATLRVLADHKASTSLVRLLTGARWRIGAGDLAALHRRSRQLAGISGDADPADEPVSLVEALDDLGGGQRYSAAGFARLTALAAELRALRRRVSAPLSELVAEVERTIGIGIEVAARADRAEVGRRNLDRLLEEASRFAADSDEASLRAFLAFLEAAEVEENGLEAGEVVVATERVQILTVHGSKGLEWDIVAVPGLMEGMFPAKAKGGDWTRAREELPGPLRGDRAELPVFSMAHAQSRREVNELLKTYRGEVEERHETEERRLAYVAFTRARSLLIASAYLWDDAVRPRVTSRFLTELRAELVQAEVDRWVEDPADGQRNPRSGQIVSSCWPLDPLGARRSAVAAGAELVRSAFGDVSAAEAAALIEPALMPGLLDDPADRAAAWRRDADLLLAERARLSHSAVIDVELPARLSVSDLVGLQRDPAGLARRLRRPLPSRPAPLARRGTAFHAWLEQRWSAQALLDVDDLPGAADSSADDSDLDALRQAFESSVWATRTPAEVEVGFDMSIEGVVIRAGWTPCSATRPPVGQSSTGRRARVRTGGKLMRRPSSSRRIASPGPGSRGCPTAGST